MNSRGEDGSFTSLRSERFRTTRTKFGPREWGLYSGRAKIVAKAPFFHLFAFAPIFAQPECEKDLRAARFRSPRAETLATQAMS